MKGKTFITQDYEEEVSVHQALRHLLVFFNHKSRVIKSVEKILEHSDDPKFFNYTAVLTPCTSNREEDELSNTANGFSYFKEEEALLKCVGESLERDAGRRFSYKNLLVSSYADIHNNAVNPDDFVSFSTNQRRKPIFSHVNYDERTIFRWVKGYDLIKNRNVFIPAQLVYLSYKPIRSEKYIYLPTTSGLAGGGTLVSALVRSIFENIERDAFLIYYLNKLSGRRIRLKNIPKKNISKIVNYIESYNLEVVCIELLTELGIPTYLTIIINRTGIGPAVSLGAKTDINSQDAILGSIQEAIHARGWLRTVAEKDPEKINSKHNNVVTLADRALLWYTKDKIDQLDFFINQPEYDLVSRGENFSFLKKLEILVDRIKKHKMDLYFVDITPSYLRNFRFKVVKTLIPQLQPFYLIEDYPCLGGKRLYALPEKLGYKRKKSVSQLNKYPHPFL